MLKEIILQIKSGKTEWREALKEYFERLDQRTIETDGTWAEDIIELGNLSLSLADEDSHIFLLEQGWNPSFTQCIKQAGLADDWFSIELELINTLKYTPGVLFRRRADEFAAKPLFRFKPASTWENRTWSEVARSVENLAAGLIELTGNDSPRVAIFSENRVEVAVTDISCLSHGFVNVPLQPSSPPAQVEYILNHAEIDTLFLSDAQQLRVIESILPNLPLLKHIISYRDLAFNQPMLTSFKHLLRSGERSERHKGLDAIRASVELDHIASIMYTSGTTGHPKGIIFTYKNIISKRFARSLALNLGSEDIFLCFLPLFHTFGRYLELWGAIFWSAVYTFSSGKGINSLLQDLKEIHPTVLISIPQRWSEMYEEISNHVDLDQDEMEQIHATVGKLSGGSLKHGLSAAGYLPPEVFKFFLSHHIQLHSGYGMTEATGGITMTPGTEYIENSVGMPLPGIELKLAEDGELWIKGAYVSPAYWKPEVPDERPDGWFTTGDIFQQIGSGQYEIIDRKKEIYKNAKGQTIAPQKIENMFREFESILQLFIVGDHQPYNTALVHVNEQHEDISLILDNPDQLRDYVASMINSVNSFLAPYERIVDFTLIDRPLDKAHGELTEKSSFKRTKILKNFDSLISKLYEKPYKSYFLGKIEVQIPNWIFLQRGWTQNDLIVDGHHLVHKSRKIRLKIEATKDEIRIGDQNYQIPDTVLKLDEFIRQPAYCVGNPCLEQFLDYYNLRIKSVNQAPEYLPGSWIKREISEAEIIQYQNQVLHALENFDDSMEALRPVIEFLYAEKLNPGSQAFRLLTRIYADADDKIRHLIRYAFLRLAKSDTLEQAQFAVEQIAALYPAIEMEKIVPFALSERLLFTRETPVKYWSNINKQKITLATGYLRRLARREMNNKEPSLHLRNVLGVLYSWANQYPQHFSLLRSALVSSVIHLPYENPMKQYVLDYYTDLVKSFSSNMQKIADERSISFDQPVLSWDDVLVFDKSISTDHQERIFQAFNRTTFFTESMYVFYQGLELTRQDLPPQGIWIRYLRSGSGKVVYRVTVQSKERSFNFVINLADELESRQLEMELHWLLACAEDVRLNQLVETLGSYQQEYKLWSEEYIPGLTVQHFLEKALREGPSTSRPSPEYAWPHFLWTGILTYTNFWRKTHYKWMICQPIPAKIIIPLHDYHIGGRLVSITGICPVESELEFLENLEAHYINQTVEEYSQFKLEFDPDIVYHAIRESLGEAAGLQFFKSILDDPKSSHARRKSVSEFLEDAESHGFQTRAVYFATRRYHRWLAVNQDATLNAKAHLVRDLYRDYNIQSKESEYPDARVQLFLWTIFADSEDPLMDYLLQLAVKLRTNLLNSQTLQGEISAYINSNELSDYEEFFLKRLAFPQLPPTEDIDLLATRSAASEEVEIMITRRDKQGRLYRIRRAMHPREIIQLQSLFFKSNMDVEFTHEHQFLVALNERDRVIGGLFYHIEADDIVYMDKIVVTETWRGGGVSRGLLDELINRLINEKRRMIVTGFLHPGYFYKFGFVTEKDQGGLVKDLSK